MSRQTYDWLVLMGLIWAAIITLMLLSGCASEPPAPIERYRAAHGFTN
jgi:hypothetical protein